MEAGLRGLPWVNAEPRSAGLVGNLFYYPPSPWGAARVRRLYAYAGGWSPDRRYAMKVLWTVRRGSVPPSVVVAGTRLDGDGSFRYRDQRVSGNDYASGLVVPSAGCWRVTVTAGSRSASIVAFAYEP